MTIFSSNYLNVFSKAMSNALTPAARETLWGQVENPIIENIPEQTDKLVTLLYRLNDNELDGKTSLYFLSGIEGCFLTKQGKFAIIPHTDIAYISLVLPCALRGTYNLVKRRDDDSLPVLKSDHRPIIYPRAIGETAAFEALMDDLMMNDRVITDPLNKKEIVYYKEMDDPSEIYGKESILELPMAPSLNNIPTSFESAKLARDELKEAGRLIQDLVQFSETSLKNVFGYTEPSMTRKYWIYLPPNYDSRATTAYPFMLFLDGCSYLDYIPAHCILEEMILNDRIPPCVAVFFDSPDGIQRSIEYNCNDRFTEFLTQDFMNILRVKHTLNITTSPYHSTIVGASLGGLAAFYIGLARPDIFGHVIAQSPAFLGQRVTVLDKMIIDFAEQNKFSSFMFELGRYENNIVEFEFEDGTIQAVSSWEIVPHVCHSMKKHGIPVTFHEFVGGHHYVCYRVSLFDRIKEVYHRQSIQLNDTMHSSRH